MKKIETLGKFIIVVVTVFCEYLFASPEMSPTAIKIMREIKIMYLTEKADRYIENYLQEKDLNGKQIRDVRERMDYFFNSQTFVETGAMYLTALFTENDLIDIFNFMRDGNFLENNRGNSTPAMKKVQKLFNELDPYLYRYMKQHIIAQPSFIENKYE
ncbi:MAG: hypothetical protein LBH98_00190 [Chitinispirillales bacterium]|jgi:hypothetical protein|nr:hypothetical protein [Chitinispirillales bacterium]